MYVAIVGKEVGRSYVLLINFVLKGKEVRLIRYCTHTQNVSGQAKETQRKQKVDSLGQTNDRKN